MGWQHVSNGKIEVRQEKTAARLEIPMHPALVAALAATPRNNLTFLTTEYGAPFTAPGFGNWFRAQCNLAGLRQCSAHGLRKAAARRLAEAGCTVEHIKAITGHKTLKEVARYTADASQPLLAGQAMARLIGTEREQKLSNHPERLDKTRRK